jgi:hypothetical protein
MSFMLLALAMLGGPDGQDVSQMRVRATTEVEAVADFETTCIAGLYDASALARGAETSKRRYAAAPPTLGPQRHRSWASPYGSLDHLSTAAAGEPSGYPQCSMTGFTRHRVDIYAMRTAVEAMLLRLNGKRPWTEMNDTTMIWAWQDKKQRWMTLYWIADPRTPQQITLSVRAEMPPLPEGYVRI